MALIALDLSAEEYAEQINRSKSTLYRYYSGQLKKPNAYLDYKLEQIWEKALSAMV